MEAATGSLFPSWMCRRADDEFKAVFDRLKSSSHTSFPLFTQQVPTCVTEKEEFCLRIFCPQNLSDL